MVNLPPILSYPHTFTLPCQYRRSNVWLVFVVLSYAISPLWRVSVFRHGRAWSNTATAFLYFNPPIRLPPCLHFHTPSDPSIHHSLTQTTTPQLSITSIMHRAFSVLALLLVSTVGQAQSESETSTLLRRAQQDMQQAAPTATDPKKAHAPAAAPKTPTAESAPKATHAVPAVPAVPGATATAAAAASAPVIPNCQASFTYAAAPTKLPINFETIKSDEWFRYQIASLRYV